MNKAVGGRDRRLNLKIIEKVLHAIPSISTATPIRILCMSVIIPSTIRLNHDAANIAVERILVEQGNPPLQSLSLVFRLTRRRCLPTFGVKDSDSSISFPKHPVGIEKSFLLSVFVEVTNGKPVFTTISILKPPFYRVLTVKILGKRFFCLSTSILLTEEERMQQRLLLLQLIMLLRVSVHFL